MNSAIPLVRTRVSSAGRRGTGPGGAGRWQRGGIGRVLLFGLAALGLLLGLMLATLTWGPHLFRDTLAHRASLMLGRTVHVDRIRVWPFAGHAELEQVVIDSLEPGHPMLTARRMHLNIDHLAYLRGVVVVRSIELDEPRVRVVRIAPDRFDLSDVIDQFTNRPASLRRTDWRVDKVDLRDGAITLDDRVVSKTTRLDGLQLSVTGLTNLESHTDRPASVQARFTLDDRPAALDATATLFAQSPSLESHAKLDALPLKSVLPYLSLPPDIRPTAGALSADLHARYVTNPAKPEQSLRLEGSIAMDGLAVSDAGGTERLAARRIGVDLAPSTPLGGELRIAQLALLAPVFASGRSSAGALAWPVFPTASTASPPSGQPATPSSLQTGETSQPPMRPRSLQIDRLSIESGHVAWSDASLPGGLNLKLEPLTVQGGPLVVARLDDPSHISGQVSLQTTVNGETPLAIDVNLVGYQGRSRVDLQRVPLAQYAPLAGSTLRAKVEQGSLQANATVNWDNRSGQWGVDGLNAVVSDLRVTHPRTKPLNSAGLQVSGVRIDAEQRRIEVAQARLDRTQVALARDAAGQFDLEQWFDTSTRTPAVAGRASGGSTGPAWSLLVRQADIDRLELDYTDALISQAKKLPRISFSGQAKDLTLDPRRKLPFDGTVSLADGSRVRASGTVQPQPLNVDSRLQLQRVDLTYLDPYIAPYVNLTLTQGQLWGAGRLQVESSAGSESKMNRLGFDGEISVNNLNTEDKLTRDDFVRWSALAAPAVTVDWRPDKPGDSAIRVGDVAFVDFYARVILSAQGRLNLSNVMVKPDQAQSGVSLTDFDIIRAGANGPAAGAPSLNAPSAGPGQRSVAAVSGPREPVPQPRVSIGPIRVASGNVVFSDLFIRPNYTANLTQLAGSIDTVASDRDDPAEVRISGRVDDDTPLDITGKVNPLAPTHLLDLRAVARGFDLPKISPYSGRWTGYAIEKGKLSADVRYRVEGDKLDAENKLTINQLTFGNKVESPDALKLPVQLAVSLLKDANGNIDLDLPISGTLSDPQFSVGGLVWRAIGNLIVRAVSSPFRFLASLGQPGAAATDLSQIEFAAGEVGIDDEDRQRLDGLASSLQARPALSLDIVGYADPQSDAMALQRQRLDRALRGTKLGDIRRTNKATELTLETIEVEPEERAALVERLWRAARLDASAQGKTVTPDEMEQQLLSRSEVSTEDMQRMAQQRADAVRKYLNESRGVDADRLYVLAPRVSGASNDHDASQHAAQRRVAFELK